MTIDTKKVNRVEVIGEGGRLIVRHDVEVVLSLQDDGKTLKVILVTPEKEEEK